MHTIEASVLVPLGLGLISVLIMLTFYLHDQTVLTAEISSFLLEWQTCPGKMDEAECEKKAAGWNDRLLITEARPVKLSAGSSLCRVQIREEYSLFKGALSLTEQRFNEDRQTSVRVLAKADPCWIRRIWSVAETE